MEFPVPLIQIQIQQLDAELILRQQLEEPSPEEIPRVGVEVRTLYKAPARESARLRRTECQSFSEALGSPRWITVASPRSSTAGNSLCIRNFLLILVPLCQAFCSTRDTVRHRNARTTWMSEKPLNNLIRLLPDRRADRGRFEVRARQSCTSR